MKYTYSFQVWPDETKYWMTTDTLPKLLKLVGRVEDGPFTEEEFNSYRYQLLNCNRITLREIERVPYHEPESVL